MTAHRIRHGVIFDPLFGYRAVRETDGVREFLGPWMTEAAADALVAEHVAAWHAAIDGTEGAVRAAGDTPLGVWRAEP